MEATRIYSPSSDQPRYHAHRRPILVGDKPYGGWLVFPEHPGATPCVMAIREEEGKTFARMLDGSGWGPETELVDGDSPIYHLPVAFCGNGAVIPCGWP